MNRLTSLLIQLSRWACRYPRGTWSLGVALAVAAVLASVTRLELKTSNLDLVDPDVPTLHRFLAFAEEFGTPNVLIIALQGDAGQNLESAVDRVGPAMEGLSGVRSVLYRAPLDEELREEMGIDEYILSRDQHTAYLFVQPRDTTSSASEIEPFVRDVRAVLAALDLGADGVTAGLTGIPEYAMNDKMFIQQDVKRLSLFALAGIVVVFMVGFGTWRDPLIAVGTLLLACIYTLGLASFLPGHLTLLSGSFVSILFGLGIDFGMHLIRRIEEFVLEGLSPLEAVDAGVAHIARSLLTGALTTSLVFFGMQFSGLRGFGELGLIAGMGVLLCLVAMTTLLPAGMLLFGNLSAPRTATVLPVSVASRWPVMGRLSAWGITALVVISLFQTSPSYDSDYLNMQPLDSEAVRIERAMVDGSDLSPLFAAFSFSSERDAQDFADRLFDEEVVGEVRTLAGWRDWGLSEQEFEDIPTSLRAQFVSGGGRYAVYAYPSENVWLPERQAEFVHRMQALDPEVTGMPVIGQYMLDQSQRSLRTVSWIALGILALCLIADFRCLRLALIAMMPAVMSFILMRLWMKLCGLSFNPINMMALPVILGIAVDDGVHLVHRFVQENGDLSRTLRGTGRSVLMTSLTSMISFGMLSFARHRGLASFGQVLFLGVSSALVISLAWLPWILLRYRTWWLRGPSLRVGDET